MDVTMSFIPGTKACSIPGRQTVPVRISVDATSVDGY